MLADEDYFCRDPYLFYHLAKICPVCHATVENKPMVEPSVSLI